MEIDRQAAQTVDQEERLWVQTDRGFIRLCSAAPMNTRSRTDSAPTALLYRVTVVLVLVSYLLQTELQVLRQRERSPPDFPHSVTNLHRHNNKNTELTEYKYK